ncbi:MAG: hypothetical protein GEV03_22720 [Streptosporangiales bacterium]|nr:hypothetical protein [Streptosporangiales bacterium]
MRVRLAGALVSGAALLAGCTGSDVPDGFAEGKASNVAVAHPEQWSVTSTGETYQAELRQGGKTAAVLTAQRIDVQGGDARGALATELTGPQMSWLGYSVQGIQDLEIEGSDGAARLNYTYRDRREKGIATGPANGVDIAVIVPGRKVDLVRLTWSDGALTAEQVDAIVSSVRYEG